MVYNDIFNYNHHMKIRAKQYLKQHKLMSIY